MDTARSYARRYDALKRERAAAPSPADPAVAALAASVRERYEVGKDGWDNDAAGVHRELTDAGHTGLMTALRIVERSHVGFRWELDFWTAELGLSATGTIRERMAALPEQGLLNPFETPSGYHPRVHLLAALEVLTAQPRRETATPLAGLLEYWFTFTEHRFHVSSVQLAVLDALVRCSRATPGITHSEYLVWLGDAAVTRPIIDAGNKFSHVKDGVTYADPVFENRGRLDLSALARAAIGR